MLSSILILLSALGFFYFFASFIFFYLVHQFPRRPVKEKPDWGELVDATVPAQDGGFLEVWRVEPEGPSRGIVLLAHGWGRNRDRMVPRARIFGKWGYTTVVHSARDHGHSSRKSMMTAMKFAEDIEAVIRWVGVPVILYGHSLGSAGAIIAAGRNPEMVTLLFLEASYAWTGQALLSLYRWFNPVFGHFFGKAILVWLNWFHLGGIDRFSPARIAPKIRIPVLLIHGEEDRRFPVSFAHELKSRFVPGKCELFVSPGAHHSNSSEKPEYKKTVKSFLEKYHG